MIKSLFNAVYAIRQNVSAGQIEFDQGVAMMVALGVHRSEAYKYLIGGQIRWTDD